MATIDEQRMREQFERWADKEVLWQHFDVRMERDEWGGYQDEMELDIAWRAWSVAAQARDAEVQRLVAALTSMVVEFDPNSENEIAAHENAVMLLAEYLPEKEVADAD